MLYAAPEASWTMSDQSADEEIRIIPVNAAINFAVNGAKNKEGAIHNLKTCNKSRLTRTTKGRADE